MLGAIHLLRSHRGGEGGLKEVANFANDSTDRLREMRTRGGEGVQNPGNFANVINGCPLTKITKSSAPPVTNGNQIWASINPFKDKALNKHLPYCIFFS